MTFCFYNNIDDPIWKNNRTVVQDSIPVHIKEDITGNIFMIYTGEINYTTACFFIVRTPNKTCLKNYNHIKVLPEIHVEADAILRVAKQILEDLHVNAFYILDNSFVRIHTCNDSHCYDSLPDVSRITNGSMWYESVFPNK